MDELQKEIKRVRAVDRSSLNEDTTKTAIVLPLLGVLGWKVSTPDEVYLEHRTGSGKVDVALFIKRKPVVFIEAKHARHHLGNKDKKQLLSYCEAAGVQIGVLTNGFNWYLYSEAASAEIDHAVEIDLAEGDTEHKILEIAGDFTRFLSKDRVDDGANARKAIEARRVDVELSEQWNKMLQDGDQKLVSALRSKMKKEKFGLSFPRVKDFIQQRSSVLANDGSGRKERASTRALPKVKERNRSGVPGRTDRKPGRVKMFGRTVKFSGWANILRTFLDEVYRKDPKYPAVLVKRIPNKVVEGEANLKPSWRPYQIAETDIWVNTNLNSADIIGLCEDVLKVLDLPRDYFQRIYD